MIELEIQEGKYSICKIAPDREKLPDFTLADFYSVTKTKDEISIVCKEELQISGAEIEKGWKCLKVKGVLDFNLVGILNDITNPLKLNNISVFVISTYNTDYILIKEDYFEKAIKVLNGEKNLRVI
jgi:hypothetical protein